jgi:hypothetical protein
VLVSKTELVTGGRTIDTVTVVGHGTCLTSALNTNSHEVNTGLPIAKLDPCRVDADRVRSVSEHGIEEAGTQNSKTQKYDSSRSS